MADNGPSAAQESTPLNDFGNNFGNKAVVLPQSLIKLLTMAERELFIILSNTLFKLDKIFNIIKIPSKIPLQAKNNIKK